MMAPRLTIVVVTYWCDDETVALASELQKITAVSHRLIVVNNGGGPRIADRLHAVHSDVGILGDGTNIGFSRACNLAAERAQGDRVLFLNPDIELIPGAVESLLQFSYRCPEAGLWAGCAMRPDGRPDPSSRQSFLSLWTLFCRASALGSLLPRSALFNREFYGGVPAQEGHVEVLQGAFLLCDMSLWRRLAGFEERYFLYGEDEDLCRRARRLGARPSWTPEARIVHHMSGTSHDPVQLRCNVLRGKATLIRDHFGRSKRAPGLLILAAWPASRALASWLLPRPSLKVWREVWRHRRHWLAGWPR